jgi:hypothetical protein
MEFENIFRAFLQQDKDMIERRSWSEPVQRSFCELFVRLDRNNFIPGFPGHAHISFSCFSESCHDSGRLRDEMSRFDLQERA